MLEAGAADPSCSPLAPQQPRLALPGREAQPLVRLPARLPTPGPTHHGIIAFCRAGEALEAYIFMGPVYYQKLKHMVGGLGGAAAWRGLSLASSVQAGLAWAACTRWHASIC